MKVITLIMTFNLFLISAFAEAENIRHISLEEFKAYANENNLQITKDNMEQLEEIDLKLRKETGSFNTWITMSTSGTLLYFAFEKSLLTKLTSSPIIKLVFRANLVIFLTYSIAKAANAYIRHKQLKKQTNCFDYQFGKQELPMDYIDAVRLLKKNKCEYRLEELQKPNRHSLGRNLNKHYLIEFTKDENYQRQKNRARGL